MGKKYNNMTEKEFDNIKLLISAGLTDKQIQDTTGRHVSTTALVRVQPIWQDYLDLRKAQRLMRNTKLQVEPELNIQPIQELEKGHTEIVNASVQTQVLTDILNELITISENFKLFLANQPKIKKKFLERS